MRYLGSMCFLLMSALMVAGQTPQPPQLAQAAQNGRASAAKIMLTTQSGDQLAGLFVNVTNEQLELETPFAGRIQIRKTAIKQWQTTDATLRQRIAAVWSTASLASPAVPASRTGASIASTAAPKPVAPTTQNTPTNPASKKIGLTPATPNKSEAWQRTVNFSYALARGNVNASDFNATFGLTRKRGTRRIAFQSLGRYSVRNGTQVAHLTSSNFRYERLLAKLPAFSETIFEIDRIKKLEYRVSENVGLSYPLLKRDGQTLSFDFGTGLMKEAFSNGKENLTTTSLLRAKAEQKINGKAQLSQQVSLFSDLLNPDNYRMQADLSLTMPITKYLGFRVAGLNRYDNNPIAASVKQNDFSLLTGLNINF